LNLRFKLLRMHEIAPYVGELRELERDIEYPIADGADAFRIDHGGDYHRFFSSMGDSRYLLTWDGDRLISVMSGAKRDAVVRGKTIPSAYLADFKIARAYRGAGISRKIVQWGFLRMLRDPEYLKWRLIYIAAMRGAHGDVTRTVRGLHPGKLIRPAARLLVYFVEPAKLAALRAESSPAPPSARDGIDLSAVPRFLEAPGVESTKGCKDLILRSTSAPWPLVHLPLGPAAWSPTFGAYVRACGEALVLRGAPGPACFAIDSRLDDHRAWLSRSAIEPGAVCTVYSLSLTPRTIGARWLHLATSEI
jgi:hypothetical protein